MTSRAVHSHESLDFVFRSPAPGEANIIRGLTPDLLYVHDDYIGSLAISSVFPTALSVLPEPWSLVFAPNSLPQFRSLFGTDRPSVRSGGATLHLVSTLVANQLSLYRDDSFSIADVPAPIPPWLSPLIAPPCTGDGGSARPEDGMLYPRY